MEAHPYPGSKLEICGDEMIISTVLAILAMYTLFKKKLWPALSSQKAVLTRLLWTVLAIVFVVAMMLQPKVVFAGALTGLKAWWNIVFPSQLPFFVASEILMNFGVVHFMGVLLEPVMRPLFNVPGPGSFVMVIGYTSGYPIGSMVTAKLRAEGLCTRIEGERLMSFTNNSSPLFMLVAVAVGMLGNQQLGLLIAGSHYLANLTLALLLRFYGRKDQVLSFQAPPRKGLVTRALRQLWEFQRRENRTLGKILGDAIASSITKLLNIGGFIILFAVIIKLLTAAGFISFLGKILGILLVPLGVSPDILNALASGFFEMTIGTKLASEAAVPLFQQLLAISIILAWSGLSVHAQVANMIAETDLRMWPFLITRVLHSALAAFYTWLFFNPLHYAAHTASPVMTLTKLVNRLTPWVSLKIALHGLMFTLALLLMTMIMAILYNFISSIKIFIWSGSGRFR